MKIKELFSDESKWTKGFYARDKDDERCYAEDSKAVKWCLIGAIHKCYSGSTLAMAKVLVQGISDKYKIPIPSISMFNDAEGTTFAQIKSLVEELNI